MTLPTGGLVGPYPVVRECVRPLPTKPLKLTASSRLQLS